MSYPQKRFLGGLRSLWNPLETRFLRVWNPLETFLKLFGNALKRFETLLKALKPFTNPFETLWNPFETLLKCFETLWKPFQNAFFGNSFETLSFGNPFETLENVETLWKRRRNFKRTLFGKALSEKKYILVVCVHRPHAGECMKALDVIYSFCRNVILPFD